MPLPLQRISVHEFHTKDTDEISVVFLRGLDVITHSLRGRPDLMERCLATPARLPNPDWKQGDHPAAKFFANPARPAVDADVFAAAEAELEAKRNG